MESSYILQAWIKEDILHSQFYIHNPYFCGGACAWWMTRTATCGSWALVVDSSYRGGWANNAVLVLTCLEACVREPGCTSVDWKPFKPEGKNCVMHGPATDLDLISETKSYHFDLTRTPATCLRKCIRYCEIIEIIDIGPNSEFHPFKVGKWVAGREDSLYSGNWYFDFAILDGLDSRVVSFKCLNLVTPGMYTSLVRLVSTCVF